MHFQFCFHVYFNKSGQPFVGLPPSLIKKRKSLHFIQVYIKPSTKGLCALCIKTLSICYICLSKNQPLETLNSLCHYILNQVWPLYVCQNGNSYTWANSGWSCCIITMISITTIHIQIHIQADSVISNTNGFINFWLRSMVTWGGWPHHNAWRILWCLRSQFISAGRDPKNSTSRLNGRKLNCPFNGRIPNYCLFQILKFSGPSLLAWRHLHSSPISCLVIVISFARGRKTAPCDYAPGLRPEWFKVLPNWMIKYD